MIIPAIELREENGTIRAHRGDGREVPIPSYPKSGTDMSEWLGGLSPAALEAARMYYMDKWTWDEGLEKYRFLVDAIVSYQRSHSSVGYQGSSETDVASFYCPYPPLT
jgi:hypothetical protein